MFHSLDLSNKRMSIVVTGRLLGMPDTSLRGRSTRTALRVLRSTEMFRCAPAAARILHSREQTHTNRHRLQMHNECHNLTFYNLLRSRVESGDTQIHITAVSHTHTHSVGGWLQSLDMVCEVSSTQRENRENNREAFLGFGPCVGGCNGCDNCYLGGEQIKQLCQGMARHPEAGGT